MSLAFARSRFNGREFALNSSAGVPVSPLRMASLCVSPFEHTVHREASVSENSGGRACRRAIDFGRSQSGWRTLARSKRSRNVFGMHLQDNGDNVARGSPESVCAALENRCLHFVEMPEQRRSTIVAHERIA